MRTIKLKLWILILCLGCLVGCSQVKVTNPLTGDRSFQVNKSSLAETATPTVIRELNKQLETYNPQVKIVSPLQNQTFTQTEVAIELAVEDLPLFEDAKLQLGNHLNLILDNEPAQKIYDVSNPVVLKDLTPGTHSIRVFAERPWGESYKNDGAYAQATFNVLTQTNDNHPEPNLPLLTYSNPTGTYSAEPILLDFYLTNTPLHSVAQNDPNLNDWRIKATINGESFTLENWQPVYLKGFNQGNNWIQLELIDEGGNDIENVYNNTVRVINYDPQKLDSLGKLMTDQISLAEAQPLIEQQYYIQPVDEPEIIEPTIKSEETPLKEPGVIENTVNNLPQETTAVEDQIEEPTQSAASAAITTPQSETIDLEAQIKNKSETTELEVTPSVETESVEEKRATTQDSDIEDKEAISLKSANPPVQDKTEQEVVAIAQEESSAESAPITTIEIPQPESVEISEKEIAITLPNESVTVTPEVATEKTTWWKKLLVGLRQKLESLVKLLPNEV